MRRTVERRLSDPVFGICGVVSGPSHHTVETSWPLCHVGATVVMSVLIDIVALFGKDIGLNGCWS